MSFFAQMQMNQFLVETLAWTAALIGLVLLIRRPIARYFGPRLAYALWALPMLRLLMPPVELPASLGAVANGEASDTTFVAGTVLEFASVSAPGAAPAAPDFLRFLASLPFIEIGLTIWLAGAAIFLFWRFNGYFKMRQIMVKDANEVGRSGSIRLIETRATTAPLAFGVRDKVIALPTGFMAEPNREARDLALAHEIAHHDGHDVLINFLVQPLFALHWFNPIGKLGWLALRRDQEAACDARVLEKCAPDQRATYAKVITSFAAGPNVALAAPMACPVLGEKSILQRLRSLKMSNVSNSRRLAGRAMMAAAVVAIPLTASVSYAEPVRPDVAVAPIAPMARVATIAAPPAPVPPAPPVPVLVQSPGAIDVETIVEDDKIFVIKKVKSEDGDGPHQAKRTVKVIKNGVHVKDQEIDEIMADVRKGLEEARSVITDHREKHRIAIKIANENNGHSTVIKTDCDNAENAKVKLNNKGGQTVLICNSEIMAHALSGLKEARDSMAKDGNLDDGTKAKVLEAIDEQIRQWEKGAG